MVPLGMARPKMASNLFITALPSGHTKVARAGISTLGVLNGVLEEAENGVGGEGEMDGEGEGEGGCVDGWNADEICMAVVDGRGRGRKLAPAIGLMIVFDL